MLQNLKELRIGFISAFTLLAIVVPSVLAAAVFLSGYFIPMAEPIKVVSAGIAIVGMAFTGLLMLGCVAYLYGEKQPEA